MKKLNRLCILIFSALLVVIVCLNGYKLMEEGISEYVEVKSVVVNDSIDSFGVFVRVEHLIKNSSIGKVHINVESGERISNNQEIAKVYNDDIFLERNAELIRLEEENELLENVVSLQKNLAETKRISNSINDSIAELNNNLSNSDFSDVVKTTDYIRVTTLKGIYSEMSSSEIISLQEVNEIEISNTERLVANNLASINSPTSGYFILGTDGYENLTMDMINVEYIENLQNESLKEYKTDNLGKVVDNYEWKFAVTVLNEDVERINNSDDLKLVFESMQDTEFDVTVLDIIKEDEKSVVVFNGKATNKDIFEMRMSDVEIILKTYSGIEIPKEAVRFQDGTPGVYAQIGEKNMFTEISPIFESEDYYLIAHERNELTTRLDILAGDRILVSSKNHLGEQVIN